MSNLKGLLKQEDFQFSMPVTNSAYGKPPFLYRNIEAIMVPFETTYEAVADILPEPLEFAGDVPTGVLMMGDYVFSNFGPYLEAIMMYNVTFEGKDYYYLPYLFVTSEVPMLAGREIWGYNKKLAEMKFIHVRNQISCTVDRPEGTRIATATVSPQVYLP